MSVAVGRLRVVVDGRPAYAEVTVAVQDGADRVTVSEGAFAWLEQDYGPGAWTWPGCAGWREEAARGVSRALAEHGRALGVVVTELRAHPAHTAPGDVTVAAWLATRAALGLPPLDPDAQRDLVRAARADAPLSSAGPRP